jgi:hypothetical protein
MKNLLITIALVSTISSLSCPTQAAEGVPNTDPVSSEQLNVSCILSQINSPADAAQGQRDSVSAWRGRLGATLTHGRNTVDNLQLVARVMRASIIQRLVLEADTNQGHRHSNKGLSTDIERLMGLCHELIGRNRSGNRTLCVSETTARDIDRLDGLYAALEDQLQLSPPSRNDMLSWSFRGETIAMETFLISLSLFPNCWPSILASGINLLFWVKESTNAQRDSQRGMMVPHPDVCQFLHQFLVICAQQNYIIEARNCALSQLRALRNLP